MNAAVAQGGIGERERLRATLVLSLLVHGMLVLGVGFALNEAAPVLPTQVVFVSEASTSEPAAPAEPSTSTTRSPHRSAAAPQAMRPHRMPAIGALTSSVAVVRSSPSARSAGMR